jgi:hypothetical protein
LSLGARWPYKHHEDRELNSLRHGLPAGVKVRYSRAAGIGPQLGHLFSAGRMHGYLNLKGYYEFDATNRPDGWNVWLTLSFSLPTPPG